MTEVPPGSVVVTPEDMWDAINEIRDGVRKFGPSYDQLKTRIDEVDKNEKDHYKEVSKDILDLKKRSWSNQWINVAAGAGLTGVVGGIALWLVGNVHA